MNIENLSIGHEIAKSAKWNIVSTIGNYSVMFISMIILARYVKPDEFGSVALASSSIALFNVLSQFGFSQAIIGIKEIDKRLTDTVFTASFLIGFLSYCILILISPYLSEFYRNPALKTLLIVSGGGVFIYILTAIPISLVQRSLNYNGQAKIALTTSFITAATSILIAISGGGVWALIIPPLVGSSTGGILAFYLSGYKPSFVMDIKRLRLSMNFGVSALISNVSNFFCNNAVVLVMGRVWSQNTLGFYSFAYSKQSIAFDLIAGQISSPLFPILSRVSYDLNRIKNAYLSIIRLSLFIILPLYIILIFGAPILFPIIFGKQWNDAILPFQILCIMQVVRTFSVASNSVLYALSLPHISAKVVIVRVIGYSSIISVCYIYHASLFLTTLLIIVVDVIVIFAYLLATLNKVRCEVKEYISYIAAPTLLAAFMAIGLSFIKRIFDYISQSNLFNFVIAMLLSLILYLLIGNKQVNNEWYEIRLALKNGKL